MSERFGPTDISQLPARIPIFPLPGVLLLPGGHLPLNIFEPRYLQMIDDALSTSRMIGMVQPARAADQAHQPKVYPTGCGGRLVSFKETDDGRYLITLRGVCRFTIAEEPPQARLFREVVPTWQSFAGDLGDPDDTHVDRERLLGLLKPFFELHGIDGDWKMLDEVSGAVLVTSLAMMAPLEPRDKQALLEIETLWERSEMLATLSEMAVMQKSPGSGAKQ